MASRVTDHDLCKITGAMMNHIAIIMSAVVIEHFTGILITGIMYINTKCYDIVILHAMVILKLPP